MFVHDFAQLGGAEKALLDLLTGLDHGKFDFEVLLLDVGPLGDQLTAAGIKVLPLPLPTSLLRASPRSAVTQLITHCFSLAVTIIRSVAVVRGGGYQTVVSNSPKSGLFSVIITLIALRRCHRIHYLHAIIPKSRGVAPKLLRWTLRRMDLVVCNSNATMASADLAKAGDPKSTVVYQGFARPTPPVDREPPGEWVIGFLGRLDPVKNLELLVQVAARLRAKGRQFRVRIGGEAFTDADRAYRDRIVSLIREKGLESAFTFEGFQHDVWSFLDGIDILMLCSQSEGFGRVAAEAMWSGRVVVATSVGGIAEIVVNRETGVVFDPNDVDQAVERLNELMRAPEETRRMARRAREQAESLLGLRQYVRNWEKLLECSATTVT